jgi:hypothetical protein
MQDVKFAPELTLPAHLQTNSVILRTWREKSAPVYGPLAVKISQTVLALSLFKLDNWIANTVNSRNISRRSERTTLVSGFSQVCFLDEYQQ